MPEVYVPKDVVCVLEKLGYEFDRQTWSHQHFKHESKSSIVTVPFHGGNRDLPKWTFKNILRQMGIDLKTFKEKLK